MQGIHHAQQFLEVAAARSGIGDHELDLLVRADHEHRPDCHVVRGIGMDHVIQHGGLFLRVGDQRKIHRAVLSLIDVFGPPLVRLQRIHADRDHFDAALLELAFDPRHVPQFGRAHRREVLGVREQDAPAIAQPFVEIDLALGRIRREVRRFVSQSQCHR